MVICKTAWGFVFQFIRFTYFVDVFSPVQGLSTDGVIEQLTDPDELLLVDLSVFWEHQTRVNHTNNTNHSMIVFLIITKFKW